MKLIFDWFRHRFKKWYQPDAAMTVRLKSIAVAGASEISCEEVVGVLGQFAHAIQRGENVLFFMPLIRQHLDVCPACREEYEKLLAMLQPPFDQ